jgi:CRP/FNR family transcriptional regulator, anaerobic regulatory protein
LRLFSRLSRWSKCCTGDGVAVSPTHRVPAPLAIPFLKTGRPVDPLVLTTAQRDALTRIALRQRLPPRTVVYREGDEARWVFAIGEGAVKSYRELRSGRRLIACFLFGRDLFGLAENGRYVNTVQTLVRTTVYRLPIDDLAALLKQDGGLQFVFLSKVTHELREAQRRSTLIARRDAAGRLAMFISQMDKRLDPEATGSVPLPMSRSDIAGFTALSLESVSRAAAELQRRHLVVFEGRHLARIVDQAAFARLTGAV